MRSGAGHAAARYDATAARAVASARVHHGGSVTSISGAGAFSGLRPVV